MHFLVPYAIWLLLLAAIPVVLYLLPLPRRRRQVASTLLWRRVVEQQGITTQRRLLRLAATILVSVFIVLLIVGAFGRVLPGSRKDARAETLTVLVLDNSASMQAAEDGTTRFDLARRRAEGLLETLPADVPLALVTTAPRAQLVVRRTIESVAVTDALRQLTPSEAGADLSETLNWLGRAFAADTLSVHVFSDQTMPSTDLAAVHHRVGSSVANAGIVAFGARRIDVPRPAVFVQARIGNFSAAALTVTLRLLHAGTPIEPRALKMTPDSITTTSWTIPGEDVRHVRLEMIPADDFVLDDRVYASLAPVDRKRVILVAEKPPVHLLSALRADRSLQVFVTTPANYRAGMPSDLTVFHRCDPPPGATGARLLVAPPSGLPVSSDAVPVAIGPAHPVWRGIAWRSNFVHSAIGPLLIYEGPGPRVLTVVFDPETEPIARTRTMPMLIRNITGYLAPRPTTDSGHTVGLVDAAESDLRVTDAEGETGATATAGSPALLWTLMIVAAAVLLTTEAVLYHRRILE